MTYRRLAILICLVTIASVSLAQEKKYAKGDKVKARYAGEVITGKVVATKASGFLEVEFDFRGKKLVRALPPTQILEEEAEPETPAATPNAVAPKTPAMTKPAAAKPATASSRPAGGTARPAPGKVPAAVEPETRTWVDATGKFKIEAKFGSLSEGTVHLLKPDGTLTKIPLDKLSEADQELAKNLAAPATSPTGPPKTSAEKITASNQPVETTLVDWSSVPGVERTALPTGGTEPKDIRLEPDPSTDPPGEFLDRPYVFASSTPSRKSQLHRLGFFEGAEHLMIDPQHNQAIVVLKDQPPGKPPAIYLVKIDLKDGKLSNALFPVPLKVRDFHPGTAKYLAAANFFLHPDVEDWKVFGVWAETGKAIEKQGAWSALRGDGSWESEPNNAIFAGPDHAVLSTFPWNVLTVWNITEGRPLYQRQMGSGNVQLTTSANGRYLAYVDRESLINLLDLPSGRELGRLPIKNMTSMAFDDSGRYLATASDMHVVIYDLQEGQISNDFYLSRSVGAYGRDPRSAGLRWVGDGYLLTAAGCLIDLKNQTILWRYELPETGGEFNAEAVYSGGRYWYVLKSEDRKEMGLFGVQIPHPDALAAAEKVDPESKVLRPGVGIRLSLNLSATQEKLNAIRDSLTKQIEAAGMKIDDSSSLTLNATTSTGQPVSGTYRFSSFGRGNIPDQTVTSTPQISTLTLSRGGSIYWKSEGVVGGHIPSMILLQEGQSAQDYVSSLSQPNFGFFETVELPKSLSEPAPEGAYGFSVLTTQGIVNGTRPPNW